MLRLRESDLSVQQSSDCPPGLLSGFAVSDNEMLKANRHPPVALNVRRIWNEPPITRLLERRLLHKHYTQRLSLGPHA